METATAVLVGGVSSVPCYGRRGGHVNYGDQHVQQLQLSLSRGGSSGASISRVYEIVEQLSP